MQNNIKKQAVINTTFFSLEKELNLNSVMDEVCSHFSPLIDWILHYFVFPFDENIRLEEEEVKEMIFESFSTYPELSVEERKSYIIGLSIVRFSSKKVDSSYLCRSAQGQDIVRILSSLPTDIHTTSTLLGVKDELSFFMQEYQYCKVS